jgi:hypothetical protein
MILIIKKTKYSLIEKKTYNQIFKRTMLSRIVKAAKTSTEIIAPAVTHESRSNYATYIVTEPSEYNTKQNDPQECHPSLEQTSCDSPDCNKKNCAQDTSSCDHDTKTTTIVGHLTQSPDNVEPSKSKIPLDHEGPRGEPVTAVIYEKPIPIPDNKMYEGYKHVDTVAVQKDENTVALNKATENITHENSDNNNE